MITGYVRETGIRKGEKRREREREERKRREGAFKGEIRWQE